MKNAFAKKTKILLYDGKSKDVENIQVGDLLLTPNGNISKVKKINKSFGSANEIMVRYGRNITCGEDTNFYILDKNNCRRPSKELKNSNTTYGTIKKGSYLLSPKINKHNKFDISKEKAWLLGLFASNGRTTFKYNKPSHLTFFTKYPQEVARKIKSEFSAASVREQNKLITVSGKCVIDFFLYHASLEQKTREISPDIVWMSKEKQLEFLRGWFSNKSAYTKHNTIIGSHRSSNMIEALGVLLIRNNIPFTTKDNYRVVIKETDAHKLYNPMLLKNEINVGAKNSYRSQHNRIVYVVKKISSAPDQELFQIEVDEGLVANGYAIFNNESVSNLKVESACENCDKDVELMKGMCLVCQLEQLDEISWRYELKCLRCDKDIKNKWGARKFCSDMCRALYYNPLNSQNTATNYQGYKNKGFVSYPQSFILGIVKDYFPKYNWAYNDRTILKNPETNYPIELDVFCKNINFAIEYDGMYHYEDKPEKLEYRQKLDKIKDEECKKKEIKLLRIAYFEDWKNKDYVIEKVLNCLGGNIE